MFKKTFTGAAAALTLGGTLIATATPAAAQWRGQSSYGQNQYSSGYNQYDGGYDHRDYGRGYEKHRDNSGAVIGAGILGLVLGAALLNNHSRTSYAQPGYYDEGYARPGYYGEGYAQPGYGGSYVSRCTTYSRWDPSWGQYVEESRCY